MYRLDSVHFDGSLTLFLMVARGSCTLVTGCSFCGDSFQLALDWGEACVDCSPRRDVYAKTVGRNLRDE